MFCTPENVPPKNCLPFAFRLRQFTGQKKKRPQLQESVTTDAGDGFSDFLGIVFCACKRYYVLVKQKHIAFSLRPKKSLKVNGTPPQC